MSLPRVVVIADVAIDGSLERRATFFERQIEPKKDCVITASHADARVEPVTRFSKAEGKRRRVRAQCRCKRLHRDPVSLKRIGDILTFNI